MFVVEQRRERQSPEAGAAVFEKLAARHEFQCLFSQIHKSAFRKRLIQIQQNIRDNGPGGQFGSVLRSWNRRFGFGIVRFRFAFLPDRFWLANIEQRRRRGRIARKSLQTLIIQPRSSRTSGSGAR